MAEGLTTPQVSNAAATAEFISHFRKTRRGHVLKIVEECYLRSDLGFGSRHGKTLERSDMAFHPLKKNDFPNLCWLVPDTNIILHQMDLLETLGCEPLNYLFILETVVDEVKHNNLGIYRRLQRLLSHESRHIVFFSNEHCRATYVVKNETETDNDRNDRAIRVAAAWLATQLTETDSFSTSSSLSSPSSSSSRAMVCLLSDDFLNRKAAKEMNESQPNSSSDSSLLDVASTKEFVSLLKDKFPELTDLVANFEETSGGGGKRAKTSGSGGGGQQAKRKESRQRQDPSAFYLPHYSDTEVKTGLMSGRFHQGTLRCVRGRWDDCYVVVSLNQGSEGRDSVLIKGSEYVNRGMEGDIVAIELLDQAQENQNEDEEKEGEDPEAVAGEKEENRAVMSDLTAPIQAGELEQVNVSQSRGGGEGGGRRHGKVVGIIRRNWKQYCGSIAVYGDEESKTTQASSVLVVPVDKKIPRIRINTRQRDHLIGKRILVAIDSWPVNSKNPLGHYVSTLGDTGDKATETAVLLLEHDIPTGDFSGDVLACLPPEGWKITEENSVGRRDLRHLPVMSIDPPGCRDIDDALHWRELGNGNCEIGIHIADVTYYIAPGTALDEEAANRSTSTYLVDRRLDMLPKMLTEKLCSLVGNEDRFAFSVLLEVNENGDILNADFCKSIIHSVGAHTYGEAQEMLDDETRQDVKAQSVRQMNRLAKIFRRRRMEAGALTLASPEVRFEMDTMTQNPIDVHMYALKETNALVEEFMLLANITVGKKILRHFPTLSVLRRHPSPSKSQFAPLISAAKAVGFDIGIADSKQLAQSLDDAEREGDAYFNKLLRIVCTRCMAPAQYFSSGEQLQEEWHHYGLATPIYTHFTSPIRRYADVCVHRLLAATIGVSSLPPQLMNKAGLHDLTENMNRRHRSAQLAGRASVGLHTQLYFKDYPTVNEPAYIIAVHPDKIVVLVPKYGIEGTIYLSDEVAAGLVDYSTEKHKITIQVPSSSLMHSVTVFDAVKVHISVAVIGGNNSDGTGRPTVRILMTEPPIGEQPEIHENERKVDGKGFKIGKAREHDIAKGKRKDKETETPSKKKKKK